jgi:hypothetical protein
MFPELYKVEQPRISMNENIICLAIHITVVDL